MKTTNFFAAVALMAGVVITQNADAALINGAKVLEVTVTGPRDSGGFGPVHFLTITFDRSLGSGCSSTTKATYQAFAIADGGQRDLQHLGFQELRAVATAALLSGRSVNVQTNGCTPGFTTHLLDFLTLK